MKLWIAIAVMIFATVGYPGKAEAGYYNGSTLLEFCESDGLEGLVCHGYLAGMSDITNTYNDWGDMNKEFCIPESATLGQLDKVVTKGFNEVPEELHLPASVLVAVIFIEAFPCD
jgi:hypothetical protein